MIYYKDNAVLIRDLEENDIGAIVAEEIAQGWKGVSADKFEMRLKHRDELGAIALMAEYSGQPAGYVNVYPNSEWGSFGGSGYCEIVDFAVLEKFRGKGIGSKLMDIAEKIAAEYSDTVYLGDCTAVTAARRECISDADIFPTGKACGTKTRSANRMRNV